MEQETPECELTRLRKEQNKARHDELFGGFSVEERFEYEARAKRIPALESKTQARMAAEKSARSAKAKQQFQWNKESETDTPQAEAHQPYRSREKGSTGDTDSETRQGKHKKSSREQDDE